MTQRVGIVPGAFQGSVKELFKKYGYTIVNDFLRDSIDILVLTGGEDINPALYNQTPLKSTYFHSKRCAEEVGMVRLFPKEFPKIGICRGAQLLNVLSGGGMWQDTDRHDYGHKIKLTNGTVFHGTSIHHQMMRPGVEAEVIGVADASEYVEDDKEMVLKEVDPYEDIEILHYPTTNSFCYQGHPEVADRKEQRIFFELVEQHLKV